MKIIKGQSFGHISPIKQYVTILMALLALTAFTVWTAKSVALNDMLHSAWDLGPIALAMAIAIVKASLVIMYFMHMKHEKSLMWMYGIIFPIGLFLLLVAMTVIDRGTRITVPTEEVQTKQQVIKAPAADNKAKKKKNKKKKNK